MFSCLVARGWEDFKFLGDLLFWEDFFFFFFFFLEEGGKAIFFHKAIIDQLCKLKNSWWSNYLLHMCMLTFHTFNWEFSLWDFSVSSSVHWNFQKRVYCCLVITLWKCQYWLIWALNKSVLFGSNSLKVSIFCDMNSKKTCYSLIWKELSENVSIVWYKLWKSVYYCVPVTLCLVTLKRWDGVMSVLFDDLSSEKVCSIVCQ